MWAASQNTQLWSFYSLNHQTFTLMQMVKTKKNKKLKPKTPGVITAVIDRDLMMRRRREDTERGHVDEALSPTAVSVCSVCVCVCVASFSSFFPLRPGLKSTYIPHGPSGPRQPLMTLLNTLQITPITVMLADTGHAHLGWTPAVCVCDI